jgi:hypothetical protein
VIGGPHGTQDLQEEKHCWYVWRKGAHGGGAGKIK